MNCYHYTVLKDEKVIKSGYLHASNDVVLEKRLSDEILPKVGSCTHISYEKAFCQKCNSNHDVTNLYFNDHELVLCQSCRVDIFKNLKT
ncbi:MAG TPA: hypothetical protein GX497_03310 [Bacillus bacterium]|nr:hypothetical protein [Bacillus sp. (in: firmicutes)]